MHVLHLSYPLSQLSSEACFLRSARVGIFTKAMCSNSLYSNQHCAMCSSQHILVTTDKLLVYDSATPGTKDHRNLYATNVDERERYRDMQMNTNSTFSNFCTADRWVRQTPSFNSTLPGGDSASTAGRVHKGKAGSQFAFASCCSSSLAFPPQP